VNGAAAVLADEVQVGPHDGPQRAFLSNPADICIGGGQAGGGKTRALLMEPLRHTNRRGFNAVLFRRAYPQLEAVGGPWLESQDMYPHVGGSAKFMEWSWPKGAILQLRSLQHEKNRLDWKGAQIALLMFDQLEEFTSNQFWYLTSRLRSVAGIRPYVRATCNPVPDDDPTGGWLNKLLAWWIDQDTGFPIASRSGKLRWMIRQGDDIVWGDRKRELLEKYPKSRPLSVSFVPMALEDNPTLLEKDPDYEARLEALPYVDQMRLRRGNWKVRATAGTIFQRPWFHVIDTLPADDPVLLWIRCWDCAGTEPEPGTDPDWTAGVLLGVSTAGKVIIADCIHGQWDAGAVDSTIQQTAKTDGSNVLIREEQEPGSSGKAVVAARRRALAGYNYVGVPSSGDKQFRWRPLAIQAKPAKDADRGNVYLVNGPWVQPFLRELENLPGGHDDRADAAAGAYLEAMKQGFGAGGAMKLSGFGNRRLR